MLHRILASCSLLVLVLAIAGGTAKAAVTNQSIAVPMYQYPTVGTYWDDILGEGGDDVPFIIVNAANGPGASVDPNYTAAISDATTAGIRSIGYVYTDYQARDYQEVLDDVDDWYTLYPEVSGIFVDLVQTGDAADVCYIASLYGHIKNNHPDDLVVLNPGTNISDSYEPYGDIFMNAENSYAGYQSWAPAYPGFDDNPANQNRFWHAVHTTDAIDFSAALSLTQANNAGWVYITDDVIPNPYDTTPTYWSTEVSGVGLLPASTIPNRGLTVLPDGCQDLQSNVSSSTTTGAQQTQTNLTFSATNTSALYSVEPDTTVDFTLPTGVTFSGSGTGWSCDTGGLCTYSADIAASGSSAQLLGAFTVSCDYTSGNVAGVLNNFAGNTDSFSVSLTAPTGCDGEGGGSSGGGTSDSGSGELADTGISPIAVTLAAAVFIAMDAYIYLHRNPLRLLKR